MALVIERYLLKTMSMFVVDNILGAAYYFWSPIYFFKKCPNYANSTLLIKAKYAIEWKGFNSINPEVETKNADLSL